MNTGNVASDGMDQLFLRIVMYSPHLSTAMILLSEVTAVEIKEAAAGHAVAIVKGDEHYSDLKAWGSDAIGCGLLTGFHLNRTYQWVAAIQEKIEREKAGSAHAYDYQPGWAAPMPGTHIPVVADEMQGPREMWLKP